MIPEKVVVYTGAPFGKKKNFEEIYYQGAKEDGMPFIEDSDSLKIWNKEFFISITKNLVSIPYND